MPVNVPIVQDLGPDLTLPAMFQTPQTADVSSVVGMPAMFQTPQTAERSSVVGNTTTQIGNSIFSPAPQMQLV